MTVQFRSETIPANGVLVLDQANLIFLLSNSAAINIQIQQKGVNEQFISALAGLKVKRVKQWSQATIQGVTGTTVTFIYGIEYAQFDQTDFQAQIATIAGGSILTSPGLGSPNAPTDHADVVIGAVTLDSTITANAARKSIIIGSLSSNAPATKSLRVQQNPGAAAGGKGIELQPGTSITLFTQARLDIANPDANAQTYWWQEQT